MTEKQKINFINDEFKDHTITVLVEQKRIEYYNNNNFLGFLFLNTNELYIPFQFYISVWFYHDIRKHFKSRYEMIEFIKPVLEKIIDKKFLIKN